MCILRCQAVAVGEVAVSAPKEYRVSHKYPEGVWEKMIADVESWPCGDIIPETATTLLVRRGISSALFTCASDVQTWTPEKQYQEIEAEYCK